MTLNVDEKYSAEDIQVETVQDSQDLYPPVIQPTKKWKSIKQKLTTRNGWIGDYDYKALWYIKKVFFLTLEKKKRIMFNL